MNIRYSILAIGLACGACASSEPRAIESVDSSGPVIVRVQGRDSAIVARASIQGPVYTVQDQHGKTVVPGMTMPQLQANHPDLARHIKTMTTSSNSGAWAGINVD
jgi:hypothetical protein